MITRIHWPNPIGNEPSSPFDAESTRALKLSFHDDSFEELNSSEVRALKALKDLAFLNKIKAVGTTPGAFPCIKIELPDHDKKDVGVRVEGGGYQRVWAFQHFGQWKRLAEDFVGLHDPQHPDFQRALQDILMSRASHSLGNDLLVTSSKLLLENRHKTWIRDTNPRTPGEAAQIVGLFLRSRREFSYHATPNSKRSFDRGLFYWVLTRHRLPSMWHYFSVCLEAGRIRKDDTGRISQSILVRGNRAHEARDEIGRRFYIPQSNNIRDEIMYHFDYLTLLLAGAFDAEARIAHRAHRITSFRERSAYLHRTDFLEAMRTADAAGLVGLLESLRFKQLNTLLSGMRNTIHGASMPSLAFMEGAEPQKSYIQAIPHQQEELWSAAEGLGSAAEWGLRRHRSHVLIEPYTFATTLTAECLRFIDKIAGATDLTGLFPEGHTTPQFPSAPPKDDIFGEPVRFRLEVLG